MRPNIENRIKQAIRYHGYELHYAETLPSSPEDIYEIKFWLEDRNQNQFDFKTIYIRDEKNPKDKAFKLLLNDYIEAYIDKVKNG